MNSDNMNTKSKILMTAIDLLGSKSEVTIREITDEAGVNVAAINYYYGNKNNLLKEVENYYSELLYNMLDYVIMDENLTPREKLILWEKSLIEFMFKYPGLIRLIVSLSTEDRDYNPILVQKIYLNGELKDKIEDIIRQGTGTEDKKILDYKYLQIFSGALGPVIGLLVKNTFGRGKDIFDMYADEDLDEYLYLVVDSVLTR